MWVSVCTGNDICKCPKIEGENEKKVMSSVGCNVNRRTCMEERSGEVRQMAAGDERAKVHCYAWYESRLDTYQY
jgi:hypothetical protein